MTGPDDDGFDDDAPEATKTISMRDLIREAAPEGRRLIATLTCIAGRAAGRLYRIETSEFALGRVTGVDVIVEDEGVSRKHAVISSSSGVHLLRDLGSRNGTILNGNTIEAPVVLKDGDRIRIGTNTVFKFGYQDEIEERMQKQLYDSATRDPLTQAFNRRYFNERFASEWAYAKRHTSPCALIAIDADHFKRVNDEHGHQAGDYVLKEIVAIAQRVVRKEDLVARVGGEEFMVLARGTARLQASVLGERIRSAVEAHRFEVNGVRIPVTISCGVATSDDLGVSNLEDMTGRADEFLYRAKETGRNRVEPPPR